MPGGEVNQVTRLDAVGGNLDGVQQVWPDTAYGTLAGGLDQDDDFRGVTVAAVHEAHIDAPSAEHRP